MFILALELGCTVSELSHRITQNELTEWIAFYKIYPFGQYAEDARNALLCTLIANIHRDSEKKKEPFKLKDFLLHEYDKQDIKPKRQSVEEMKNILMSMVAKDDSNRRPRSKTQIRQQRPEKKRQRSRNKSR